MASRTVAEPVEERVVAATQDDPAEQAEPVQQAEQAAEPHPEGLFPDVPEPVYHADPTSLSQTGAKTLLECPAQYAWERAHPKKPTEAMEFGSAVDQLLFGGGGPETVVVDAESWRSPADQETRRRARAQGGVALLRKTYRKASDMAQAVFDNPEAAELLTGGRGQVSAWCRDEATGVLRRGRFDYLLDDLVVDYKTSESADPKQWARTHTAKYGYHIQNAWYLDLARDLGLTPRGFVFVVQQTKAPYLVSCVELTRSAVERGRELGRLALERFRDCTESGVWPDYSGLYGPIVPVDIPEWAYRTSYADRYLDEESA